MVEKIFRRVLFAPFSLIYGFVVGFRNILYDVSILKSSRFHVPVIGVGNISMGGSGKTPHVEYLIRMLRPYMQVGTLSRGYMRKTRGYLEVLPTHTIDQSGDEALQYKLKYPEVVVSVCEQRALGIPNMVGNHPDLKVIILDDAFQHRSVQPALNILLTDFKNPFFKDVLIPGGRLREWRNGVSRADAVIISKCPSDFKQEDMAWWKDQMNLEESQRLFFSYYSYGKPYYMYNPQQRIELDKETDVVMLTGIAHAIYLEQYLKEHVGFVNVHAYEDHHDFKPHEVSLVQRALKELTAPKKVIITTEKDSTRLDKHRDFIIENKLPVLIIPVEVKFFEFNESSFDDYIKETLLNYKA